MIPSKLILCFFPILLDVNCLRDFRNPVIQSVDASFPRILTYNGMHYITFQNEELSGHYSSIYQSDDFQNWGHVGYIFNKTNYPFWANRVYGGQIIALDDGTFRFYFEALASDSSVVGVAFSDDILGPYTAANNLVLANDPENYDIISGISVFKENGSFYIVWDNFASVMVAELLPDGLGIKKNSTRTIYNKVDGIGGYFLNDPWIYKRNDFYYIFYTSAGGCIPSGLYVARSTNFFSDYESFPLPMLLAEGGAKAVGYGIVTSDLENNDLILFQSRFFPDCLDNVGSVNVKNLMWNEYDWPVGNTTEFCNCFLHIN